MKFDTYDRVETVQAIRITAENRDELSNTVDIGDGCVEFADDGDWLVTEDAGNQIYDNGFFRRNFKKS